MDGAAVLGERNGLHPILREDMHIVRPQRAGVGAAGGIGVVVAGRDAPSGPGTRPARRPRSRAVSLPTASPSNRSPASSRSCTSWSLAQSTRRCTHLPALGPALAGLLRRQRAEGAVQMEVAGMQDAYHHASSVLPALAHVHPLDEVLAAAVLQLVTGQLDGAGGAAHGGEHRLEAASGTRPDRSSHPPAGQRGTRRPRRGRYAPPPPRR